MSEMSDLGNKNVLDFALFVLLFALKSFCWVKNPTYKLLYLVSQDIEEKWTVPIQNWGLILNQLMVYFEGRI